MFDFEYVGNLHIHTRHSDGDNDTRSIVSVAAEAGLDFICLNDHDYMTEGLHLDEEGFHKKVMVFVGLEIGRKDHHYLAYDLKKMLSGDNRSPQEVIDRVNQQGGFGFLAHPFEKGMPFVEKSRSYAWKDLSVTGFQGICIWNFASRWKERVKSPFHALVLLAFKHQLLKGPSRRTLNFWDKICRERQVSAIGGSDAHGNIFKWGFIRFRPLRYDFLLNTINVHVLLHKKIWKDFKAAKRAIYEALREGRLFIAHDGLCPARGFRFDFVGADGSDLVMGEAGMFQKGDMIIELPREGEIRLIRDGRLEKSWRAREVVYKVRERGVYRVEVYHRLFLFGWRPWIFSNPIYLR